MAVGHLLTPRWQGRLATLPAKDPGLIQAVYLDVCNANATNLWLHLGKTEGYVMCSLNGEVNDVGIPFKKQSTEESDGLLLLSSKKKKKGKMLIFLSINFSLF